MSDSAVRGNLLALANAQSEEGLMDYRLIGNSKARRGVHHFITNMAVIGQEPLVLPVLWVRDPNTGQRELVEQLFDYQNANDAQSWTWQLFTARAVGMLFDFVWRMTSELAEFRVRRPNGNPYLWLLRSLARCIHRGTIRFSDGKSCDDRGLWWPPRSSDSAKQLIGALVQFLDWIGDESESKDWKKLRLTDAVIQKRMGPLKLAFCMRVRKKTSFLGHIKKTPKTANYRALMADEGGNNDGSTTLAFPEKYIWPFIALGFRSGADKSELDVVAMLIAILCMFCGLRESEPMNLFVDDFQLVNGRPVIRLRHPVHSKIKYRGGLVTRQAYLNREFGLHPRTLGKAGGRKAGWKAMAGDMKDAQAHFLDVPGIEEFFSAYMVHYLTVIRPKLARIGGMDNRNPYLFLSSGKKWGKSKSVAGSPYTVKAFLGAWRRALDRIAAMFSDPELVYSKDCGTTPHGGRHFCGRFLEERGGDSMLIMQVLHHLSPFSQLVYTRATPAKVDARMKAGWSTASGGTTRTVFDALESQIRGWNWRPWHGAA